VAMLESESSQQAQFWNRTDLPRLFLLKFHFIPSSIWDERCNLLLLSLMLSFERKLQEQIWPVCYSFNASFRLTCTLHDQCVDQIWSNYVVWEWRNWPNNEYLT
jgi:hypothetical protein